MPRPTRSEDTGSSHSPSNTFFDKQWVIYQKVLKNNYMGHREIYAILHKFFSQYFHSPFSMLDLGCGDANYIARSLLNTKIAAYTGIDLSNSALTIAQENMMTLQCKKIFRRKDLYEVVNDPLENKNQKFDVIFASFALHHLTLRQKDIATHCIYQLLNDNGVFVLVDVVRQKGESRDTYLNRYLKDVRQRWSSLTSEEYTLIEEHITSNDLPETRETLQSLARKHGFAEKECLYIDALSTTQLLVFYKQLPFFSCRGD